MKSLPVTGHGALAIDLNQPGTYLHWSIFDVSVANLVLIAVMVAIFGAALLLPFPGRRHGVIPANPGPDGAAGTATAGDQAETSAVIAAVDASPYTEGPDSKMWTARFRRRTLAALPQEIATLRGEGYQFVTITQMLGYQLIYK